MTRIMIYALFFRLKARSYRLRFAIARERKKMHEAVEQILRETG